MDMNPLALMAAALIPLVIGLIWYSPVVAGRVAASGAAPINPILRVLLLVLLGVLVVVAMMPATIHQMHLYSILAGQPQAEVDATLNPIMAKYGGAYRTFKHGAFHGTLTAIFTGLPILGISILAERKRGKVVLAHLGCWIITMALAGGIVCGYGIAVPK